MRQTTSKIKGLRKGYDFMTVSLAQQVTDAGYTGMKPGSPLPLTGRTLDLRFAGRPVRF